MCFWFFLKYIFLIDLISFIYSLHSLWCEIPYTSLKLKNQKQRSKRIHLKSLRPLTSELA